MADPRFFIDQELAVGATIALPTAASHHAARVLRLRDGDRVVLFNGRGGEFHGVATAGVTRVDLARHDAVERESPMRSTLLQAWIATDKLEWVVEKAVELGVSRIVLAPARRSVVQLTGTRRSKRVERLREIAVTACCQCGRNRLPAIDAFDDLPPALEAAVAGATGLLMDPEAREAVLDVARGAGSAFAFAVGPEGGFDPGELALAGRAGYRAVRLGPRILRTETAGLAALAALQSARGDFAQ